MAKKSAIERLLDKESELAALRIDKTIGIPKDRKKEVIDIIRTAVYSSVNASVDFFKSR